MKFTSILNNIVSSIKSGIVHKSLVKGGYLYSLSKNVNISLGIQERLLNYDNDNINSNLAGNVGICRDVGLFLIDKYRYQHILVRNSGICRDIQIRLAYSRYNKIRWEMARHPRICREAGLILSGDIDFGVRCILACNKYISDEIREILSKDYYSIVRYNLNDNTGI